MVVLVASGTTAITIIMIKPGKDAHSKVIKVGERS
jgi:hypothetical protein